MAKLFYGVSTSSGDSDKNVKIFNPLEETLMPGDLLAVYFAHGNTKPAPNLTIGDISLSSGEEESTSQSSDHGDTIKTHDVTAEVDYMWQSGEVCLFVLTSQQFNTDVNQDYEAINEEAGNNALHYMLIRGPRANSEYYGLAKLFTDGFPASGQTFQQWLEDETDGTNENDKTTAATPYLIKQLYNYLIGKLTPEPEPGPGPEPTPTPTPLPFKYESNVEEGYVIGTLTLGNGTFEVKIPVSESYEVERTSQLVNDADIVNVDSANIHNRGNSPQVGGYFITNVVDNGNLYLYKPDNNSVGLYVSIPVASGQSPDINTPVEGGLKVLPILARESGSPGATSLNKGFLDSPLRLYGQNINLYSNGSSNPTFIVKSNEVTTTGDIPIKAKTFYEDGVSLASKYSKKLVIKKFRIGQGKTDASDGGSFSYHDGEKWASGGNGSTSIQIGKDNVTTGHMKVRVDKGLSGYTPLSIAGWNVSKTSGSGYTPAGADSNAREVSLWELYLTNRATGSMVVHYDARNLIQGTKICFVLDIDVLCVKS